MNMKAVKATIATLLLVVVYMSFLYMIGPLFFLGTLVVAIFCVVVRVIYKAFEMYFDDRR